VRAGDAPDFAELESRLRDTQARISELFRLLVV
jgi:hypothetical protein